MPPLAVGVVVSITKAPVESSTAFAGKVGMTVLVVAAMATAVTRLAPVTFQSLIALDKNAVGSFESSTLFSMP